MPERYLREYDPVTLFFDRDRGPVNGGPGDDAQGILSIQPSHPGEYRWLDARTLQFLPAEAWPALRSFTFKGEAGTWTRSTLMAPPTSLNPQAGSANLKGIEGLNLTFPTPLAVADLAEMVSLEVRALPGLGSQEATRLTKRDFSIKEIDRSDRKSPAQYRLTLAKPIGDGKAVTLSLRLSLDSGIPGAVASYTWSTRTDFRLLSFGSGRSAYPVSSSGSNYPADQAIGLGSSPAPLFLEFSEAPEAGTSLAVLRSMVSFEPAVKNLRFEFSGSRILLQFDRDADTDYRLKVEPGALRSASGRSLSAFAPSSFHFWFKGLSPYVQWSAGQAILERDGPKAFPMQARGVDKVDLRLYRIDPLDPNYWPFPEGEVKVSESAPPPMPGEEPAKGSNLASQIRLLGSPDFSGIVDLPTREKGGAASFGLDLGPILARLGKEKVPGTWLVGYRRLGSDPTRSYVRVQVTDLCLTVVEEEAGLVFVVTSLATAKPVPGARIRLEARRDNTKDGPSFPALVQGTTDKDGRWRYSHAKALDEVARRLVVESGADSLVIDPAQAPPYFHNNHWFGSGSAWLSWLNREPQTKDEAPLHLGYLFTERPLYRAEEAVHIQGYVRVRQKGLILADDAGAKRSLVIRAPDGKEYRYPVSLQGNGWFYKLFDEKDLPTGSYNARLLDKDDRPLATVSFQKEAYRVPSFDLSLNAPERVAFDRPFKVLLTASFYAGGKVAGQAVEWSVAEGTWTLSPSAYPGYDFSTYLSVGGEYRDEGVSSSDYEDVTDDNGSATLEVDPRKAQSVEARYYRVQASVRGADAQTVSQSTTVYALPPFSIGLKLAKFETEKMAARPSVVVLNHEEKPFAGKELTLRLYERQWHSYLAESDLSTGQAKYVSDVVDVPVLEKAIVSQAGALDLELPVQNAGVYIVEILGRDEAGRVQSVKRDLYISGPTPVAWKKTTAAVFETSLEKTAYTPGETARLLVKSPFQEARALVVVEKPAGNAYSWVDIKDGQGLVELPVSADLVPRFPVHLILMRGRLPGSPAFQGGQDRMRPLSVANTTWIVVDPDVNRLVVDLVHETKALPGSTFAVKILVKDREGKPVDGEVALWLVDRAVLSLARERFGTPLTAFITDVSSRLKISDSRNLAVGNLPFEELAGGDMAEMSKSMAFGPLLDKSTVRKNFKTVPYYNPGILIRRGQGEVSFTLPDNLTEFALRAIATSGFDKFGTGKSVVALRLPVVVQESLPRFVRPGDGIKAGGIARVVEGEGGPARSELELGGGLVIKDRGSTESANLSLDKVLPTKLLYPLVAPLGLAKTQDSSVSVTLGVQRLSDGAKDAFLLELPVRRDTVIRRMGQTFKAEAGATWPLPLPPEAARPGSTVQTIYLVSQPELVRVLSSLRFQLSYPYGCTEQRLAKVHAPMALEVALGKAGLPEEYQVPEPYLAGLFSYLEQAITPNGLYAFYPGSQGSVYLTAYVVEFLSLAKASGRTVPASLLARPLQALKEALRSDYDHFSQGYSLLERALALFALDAAGSYVPSYAEDLLSLAQDADITTQAKVWLTLQGKKGVSASALKKLRERIDGQAVFQRQASGIVFAGLQQKRAWFGNPFLSSDYASVAALYSVFARDRAGSPETKAILAWLLEGAGDEGWGDTYTNTQVLLSLTEALKALPKKASVAEVWDGRSWRPLDGSGKTVASLRLASDASLKVRMKSLDPKNPPNLLLDTTWIPAAPGSELRARNEGFVVTRELLDYGKGTSLLSRMPASAGKALPFVQASVIEDHVRVINPKDRVFVAIRVPLASGFEPLNPKLATAPAEAKPVGRMSLEPSYADYTDDEVTFYYNSLPAGTYDFYFRVRANFEGSFQLPPAVAQVLYELPVTGTSEGSLVVISPAPSPTGR